MSHNNSKHPRRFGVMKTDRGFRCAHCNYTGIAEDPRIFDNFKSVVLCLVCAEKVGYQPFEPADVPEDMQRLLLTLQSLQKQVAALEVNQKHIEERIEQWTTKQTSLGSLTKASLKK